MKDNPYLFSDIKSSILAYELAKLLIKDENKHVEILHETVHNIIKLLEDKNDYFISMRKCF
jgi:hypothetical protein